MGKREARSATSAMTEDSVTFGRRSLLGGALAVGAALLSSR